MVVALIVVGPDKLPGLARTVGKQVLDLKKAANSLKDSLQDELVEEKKQLNEIRHDLDNLNDTLNQAVDDAGDEPWPGINPPADSGPTTVEEKGQKDGGESAT